MEGVYINSNSSVVFVNPPAALDLSRDEQLHFLLWYIYISLSGLSTCYSVRVCSLRTLIIPWTYIYIYIGP